MYNIICSCLHQCSDRQLYIIYQFIISLLGK